MTRYYRVIAEKLYMLLIIPPVREELVKFADCCFPVGLHEHFFHLVQFRCGHLLFRVGDMISHDGKKNGRRRRKGGHVHDYSVNRIFSPVRIHNVSANGRRNAAEGRKAGRR